MPRDGLVQRLLASPEPAIRYRVHVGILDEDPQARSVRRLQDEIKGCERVARLLAGRDRDGRLLRGRDVYAKWQGAHWTLGALAELGYPPGDETLKPIRDQVLECWLDERYYEEFEARSTAQAYAGRGVPLIQDRYRSHGSQQGLALESITRLGLETDDVQRLGERLLHWQWPDGGWNCDRTPSADTSSFMETLLPMRGLWCYGTTHGAAEFQSAAVRAAEVFLSRRLFKRRADGQVIHKEFVKLHFPLYWHYDFLGGLKAMAQLGLIADPRCADALDLLEQKELPDGGWPADNRYYRLNAGLESNTECVDWGPVSKRNLNEWVTTDALTVLHAAGRR
jgi:hypothetical protein